MAAARKLMRRPFVREALSWLGARYIRFVWLSGRWRIKSPEVLAGLIDREDAFIACFWHGRMLMLPNVWSNAVKMNVLISRHRDGVLISRTLEHLGIGTISGSTSKGGAGALAAMVRVLRRGEFVSITPDGPRGPSMRVAPGAIAAAKLSGAYLLPVSFSARWRIVSGSWDSMIIPLPFTRGIVGVGTPFRVPRDASDEDMSRLRRQLEADMIALTNELDSDLGVDRIAPAGDPAADDVRAAGG